MSRKRLTQRFPALIPLRQAQRKACFYLGMRLDGRRYAAGRGKLLPLEVFSQTVPLYNRETGFPMVYQENKVFNLRLAAKELEGLLIRPGETFSFFRAVREPGDLVQGRAYRGKREADHGPGGRTLPA